MTNPTTTETTPSLKPRSRGSNRPKARNGRWQIRWYDEHLQRHSATFDLKRDADEALRKAEHRVDLARNGMAPPPSTDRVVRHTFKEVVAHWTEHRQKRSMDDDESILKAHLTPAFGTLVLEDITLERIDAFRTALAAKVATKTQHNILTLLVSLLRQARDLGWLPEIPKIAKPKIRKPTSRDYKWLRTADELQRFLAAARAEKDRTVYNLYATAILSGLRAGELAGLRPGDIDLDRHTIHVRRSFDGPTKSGEDRIVPIVDDLHALLTAWVPHARHDLVFSSTHGTMFVESGRIYREIFHRVMRRAELPEHHIVFHSLRHTFASWWVIQGGDLYKLQAILGHTDPKITMRYAHLSPSAFVEDRHRFGGFLSKS